MTLKEFAEQYTKGPDATAHNMDVQVCKAELPPQAFAGLNAMIEAWVLEEIGIDPVAFANAPRTTARQLIEEANSYLSGTHQTDCEDAQ